MEENVAVPGNLQQAYSLVERLTIDDLRVFCSTFGLNDSGTKENLKKRLIQYYKVKFVEDVEIKDYDTMRQAESTEERINNVENSVRELKFSLQSELAGFRQSMEVIMTQLQAPVSSTPLPYKVNFVEESPSTQEDLVSDNNLSQQDTLLLSKMNRKKRFLTSSVERLMTELQRLISGNADVKLVERKLDKLNSLETECIKAIDEIVTQVDNDELAENEMEH